MEYRRFGTLDFEVSVIGFGGAAVSGEGGGYGFGDISAEDAIALLHRAYDAGINLFDTAPVYGFGLSEQRIGKAFKGMREQVFLVSKSGVVWDNNRRLGIDNRPHITRKMLEQSLRDLQTDRIDLYLIHWPDPKIDIRQPMEVLVRAKESGQIGAIGLSNTNLEDLTKAQEIGKVEVVQAQFNLFEVYPREHLFEFIRSQEIGFMTWGTLDKGILTGRVDRQRADFANHDVRSHAPWWTNSDREPKYRAMDEIRPLLEADGYTGLQLALGFVLQYPEVSTALCGIRNQHQLDTSLEAIQNLPPPSLLQKCEQIANKYLAAKGV
jgi:aryl-alcohol dehydrogenase-like predicted oxidoreductase